MKSFLFCVLLIILYLRVCSKIYQKIVQIEGPFMNNNLAQKFWWFFPAKTCQRFYGSDFILNFKKYFNLLTPYLQTNTIGFFSLLCKSTRKGNHKWYCTTYQSLTLFSYHLGIRDIHYIQLYIQKILEYYKPVHR